MKQGQINIEPPKLDTLPIKIQIIPDQFPFYIGGLYRRKLSHDKLKLGLPAAISVSMVCCCKDGRRRRRRLR